MMNKILGTGEFRSMDPDTAGKVNADPKPGFFHIFQAEKALNCFSYSKAIAQCCG
jgi:hypothetical protein